MQITFEAKNIAQAQRMLLGIHQTVEDLTKKMVHSIGDTIVKDIKDQLETEGHNVTYDLSEKTQVFEYGEDYVVLGSDSDHAWVFEYGRGPVRPVFKKALRWYDKATGKPVFARYAKAFPGTLMFTKTIEKHASPLGLLVTNKCRQFVDEQISESGVKEAAL